MNGAAEELDRVADLCARLDFAVAGSDLASRVLEPIAVAVGAETASLRSFGLVDGVPRPLSIVDLAIPNCVREAYLDRYFELDPVRSLFGRRLARPLFADPERSGQWSSDDEPVPTKPVARQPDFRRYRNEFLLPNHFYHHVGFRVQGAGGELFALDFHRRAHSPQFGALERARARVVAGYLHAKASVKRFAAGSSSAARTDAALTRREAEVADAVARGLSNKQVAESLAISVRTVENHLRSIFSKCNVATRTRLAAKLRGQASLFS